MFLFYFLHFICVIVIDEGGPILFLFSLKIIFTFGWLLRGVTDQFIAALEVCNSSFLPETIVANLLITMSQVIY